MSLPKARRVTRSAEFRTTYTAGVRISSRFFVAFCQQATPGDTPTRFGFTCPRALGKAVIRNRIKRRMREAVRSVLPRAASGWIIVFNPRRTVVEAPFPELCKEVSRILSKCDKPSSVS